MAKTLKIVKDNNEYTPGKFAQYSNKGFALAAQTLNKNGLLLWLYLCNNKDGFEFTLSPTAISNELGVTIDVAKSMTSTNKGLKELEAAGFIRDGKFYAEGFAQDIKEPVENSSENLEISSEKTKIGFEF